MVAEHREVLEALLLRPLHSKRRRWGCGLEADGVEDYLAVGVLARNAQRVQRRVDHADVGAFGFDLQQVTLRTRDPHHVPEAREDDLGALGHGYAVVHAAHGEDADRATRTVDELYLIR